jgi:hypothetical protein
MFSDTVLFQWTQYVPAAFVFLVLIAGSESGFRLGLRRSRRMAATTGTPETGRAPLSSGALAAPTPQPAPTASTAHLDEIQTMVFAVLGLLLAFTFSMAVSRFDVRKQYLSEEVTAISTAYLRAQLLPPAQQATATERFRRYVDARLASARPDWEYDTALRQETSALQQQLWTQGVAFAQHDPQATTGQLYLQALSDMFDAQSRRDAARLNYLPATAFYLILVVAMLAAGILGYRSGLGGGRSLIGSILLALVISLVVLIILDFDHPYHGLTIISQQGMEQLRQRMGNGP